MLLKAVGLIAAIVGMAAIVTGLFYFGGCLCPLDVTRCQCITSPNAFPTLVLGVGVVALGGLLIYMDVRKGDKTAHKPVGTVRLTN